MSRADADAADDPAVTPETVAIREDIEQTRAEMSGTIDAIQDKLDPEVLQEQAKDTIREAKEAAIEVADHAIQQAKDAVKDATGHAGAALRGATIGKVEDMARYAGDTAGGWRHTLTQTVKAHPIPAAIAGLSLGYLFLNRESKPEGSGPQGPSRRAGGPDSRGYAGDRGYGVAADYRPAGYTGGYGDAYAGGRAEPSLAERAGDMAGQAQERAGDMAGQVQETAGQMVDQARETAGQMVDQVQEGAHRAQSFLGRQLDEHPLAVGAVAAVLGGALAATMGTTPREDRLFGATRDRFMGRAQEAVQDVSERVERVVDEVKDTAGRAAEEVSSTAQREARAQDLIPGNR